MNINLNEQVFVFGDAIYKKIGQYGAIEQEHINLSYVTEGVVHYQADGKDYTFKKGDLAFIYNSYSFTGTFEPGSSVIWCHSGAIDLTPDKRIEIKALPISTVPSPLVLMLLEQGSKLVVEGNLDAINVRNTLGIAAFYEYFRLVKLAEVDKCLSVCVRKTRDYIVKNYNQVFGLIKLAQLAGVTPNYLLSLFKTQMGVTPTDYLWHIRVENGIDQLQHTGLSVSEVAKNCGFKTSQHFSRTIKHHYGKTPTQVRAQPWETDPIQIDRALK